MTKSKVDPYIAICPQCKAPVGFNCTYVHPRDWTPESQHRFFNHKSTEEQIKIIQRAGEYTKTPHLSRFVAARKVAEEQAKTYNWATQEPGYAEAYEQPMLTWDYQPPVENVDQITFNGVIFRHPNYIDKVLAEARAEWEQTESGRINKARMEGYREGHSDGLGQGIREGLGRAINMIATGSEEGD